jgi:hypothetical protein
MIDEVYVGSFSMEFFFFIADWLLFFMKNSSIFPYILTASIMSLSYHHVFNKVFENMSFKLTEMCKWIAETARFIFRLKLPFLKPWKQVINTWLLFFVFSKHDLTQLYSALAIFKDKYQYWFFLYMKLRIVVSENVLMTHL